jgi:hypothetical protein
MEKECLRHSVQDVVVPYTIMLKVALEITKLRQIYAFENIFPALYEALELSMSKSPADLRNENGGCLKPTLYENLVNELPLLEHTVSVVTSLKTLILVSLGHESSKEHEIISRSWASFQMPMKTATSTSDSISWTIVHSAVKKIMNPLTVQL